VSAINLGLAVENPYLPQHPPSQVDLWDSNPLTACCTTPIGYHPSRYGVYLDALTIFYQITGIDPVRLDAEMDARHAHFQSSAAHALGISPADALLLAFAARETVRAGRPVCLPHEYSASPCAVLLRPLHGDYDWPGRRAD